LVETAVISVQDWRDGWRVDETAGALRGWDVTTAVGPKVLFDNPLGVDLTTIDDSAFHLLGKTVKELCAPLEEANLPIIHVENVLRSDLVSRFKVRQQRMMGKFMQCSHHQLRQCVPNDVVRSGSAFDSRSDLARELCRPRATTGPHDIMSLLSFDGILPFLVKRLAIKSLMLLLGVPLDVAFILRLMHTMRCPMHGGPKTAPP
jgi:hypothetical protein